VGFGGLYYSFQQSKSKVGRSRAKVMSSVVRRWLGSVEWCIAWAWCSNVSQSVGTVVLSDAEALLGYV
jgi:hypothetical protein